MVRIKQSARKAGGNNANVAAPAPPPAPAAAGGPGGLKKFKWKSSSSVVPASAGAAAASAAVPPPRKEVPMGPNDDPFLPEPPQASIQAIAWAPQDYRLAAGCWDGTITIWNVKVERGDSHIHRSAEQPLPFFTGDNHRCPAAVLDLAWHPDGLVLYAACADGRVYGVFFERGEVRPVCRHGGPVRCLMWCKDAGVLVTGSWDRSLRFWRRGDGSEHTLVKTIATPERVYALDVWRNVLVVAVAGHGSPVLVYRVDTAEEARLEGTDMHPLKFQARCVKVFGPGPGVGRTAGAAGYILGSIEGRCAVRYFDYKDECFAFKCHRDSDHAYAVNDVDFHPRHNTFATAGSDGTFVFWDKDSKSRLRAFSRIPPRASITSGRFSADGAMFAYAQSYDWAKGHDAATEEATVDCVRIHWTYLGVRGSDECARQR